MRRVRDAAAAAPIDERNVIAPTIITKYLAWTGKTKYM